MTTSETPEIAVPANGQQDGTQRPLDLRTLFDAGVHFGHPSKRWNPKMEKYIFAKRARSHIFDLAKTVEATENAKDYLRKASSEGAQVLMVGTKKQAQGAIREHALRSGAWYINQRWLGGMLTNFQTIQKRIERLVYLEDALAKGTVETQTKRESLRLQTEVNRLNKFFGGIKEMERLPDVLFIIDTEKEDIAVREARRLNIPIVAVIDTNSNPDDGDYVIPGNDDAVRSVELLTAHIADAILEGKNLFRTRQEERMAEEAELEAQEAAARAQAQAQAAERAAAAQARANEKAEEAQAEADSGAAAAVEPAEATSDVATDEKAEAEKAPAAKGKAKTTEDEAEKVPAAKGKAKATEDKAETAPAAKGKAKATEDEAEKAPAAKGKAKATEDEAEKAPAAKGKAKATEDKAEKAPAAKGKAKATEDKAEKAPAAKGKAKAAEGKVEKAPAAKAKAKSDNADSGSADEQQPPEAAVVAAEDGGDDKKDSAGD